jgi:hypothetical protein
VSIKFSPDGCCAVRELELKLISRELKDTRWHETF